MRVMGIVMLGAALGGCAAVQVAVPVSGQIGGKAAAGQAIGRGDGSGDFWAQIPGGLRCDGKYDSLNNEPSFVIPVTCSNGQSGEMVVTRAADRVSGSAIATLSDGTKGQFVFGNLKFDQTFGSGGGASTVSVVRRAQ
jgi:hypothetical protein